MQTQIYTKRKVQQAIVQYSIVTIILLGLGGYFGYNHYVEYQATTNALNSETQKLAELKGSADKAKKDYLALKKEMDSQNSSVNESIEKILPNNEDFTNLARELDKYFLNTANATNPMFLSDLRFNSPNTDDTAEIATLPFSMNVSGSENGFKDFLNYIEKSGDLNDRSRLLKANSMNLSFSKETSDSTQSFDENGNVVPTVTNPTLNVSATLSMEAYFQKPETEKQQ